MEWLNLINTEIVIWCLAGQAVGYAICWFSSAKPAKQELSQLKQVRETKVEFRNVLAESEALLERLRTDYPHLMDAGPRKPASPYHPRGWRTQ